ncbi:hypothetical protein IEN52_07895 [Stenotrophomonas rhizophila]|nr:hypothetical protein [Stenotrophomonas rhizophila]MCC7634054.1 hypothetical protein [Stenotrophomonas rhizophila]MCC7662750.1 hypothetical protein [Stenotrophomonas rhizophila]
MGYTVFVDGQIEEVAPVAAMEVQVAVAAPPRSPAAADSAPRAAPPPRRSAPASAEAPAAAAPAVLPERGSGVRRPAVRMPDRLQIALLRASGCNPAEPGTQALMAGWNLDQLRGNAAAKRALWPQLRALRKRGRP